MRVSLSAGGMGEGLSVRRLALPEEAPTERAEEPEQYQLFDTPEYSYRVFVTNMTDAIDRLVGSTISGRARRI